MNLGCVGFIYTKLDGGLFQSMVVNARYSVNKTAEYSIKHHIFKVVSESLLCVGPPFEVPSPQSVLHNSST